MKITTDLNVIWKVNKRLKRSLKYSVCSNNIEIQYPASMESLSLDQKHTILRYIKYKKDKKRIPQMLQKEFNALFPSREERSVNIRGYVDDRYHPLGLYLKDLNAEYFNNACAIKEIGWSYHHAKRKLGKYYLNERVIILSSIFNHPEVPEYVVKSVIHHEMCHQLFPPMRSGSKLLSHHKQFRENEKKFKAYAKADAWIKKNIK